MATEQESRINNSIAAEHANPAGRAQRNQPRGRQIVQRRQVRSSCQGSTKKRRSEKEAGVKNIKNLAKERRREARKA